MSDVPVFRMTFIAALTHRLAQEEARQRRLRSSEWIYVTHGWKVRGYHPDCPLVLAESFHLRPDAAEIVEELREWKREATPETGVDAPN